MKNLILKMTLATSILFFHTFTPHAVACEEHEKMNQNKAELPSASIYQLSSDWVDQNGKQKKFSDFAGRPRLMAMVYTRCETACPLLVQDLKTLSAKVSKDGKHSIAVDLFSFDSEKETPETLKDFTKKYKVDEEIWTIHTAKAESVSELAAALGVQFKKLASGDYIHANIIFLVNDKGEIIAKHEGLKTNTDKFLTLVKKSARKS